jgi:acyl-CoA ligase (AMP-forming) (exosortase A-associated)
MTTLLHDFVLRSAADAPERIALLHKGDTLSYRELADGLTAVANGLAGTGLRRQERIAIYLPKRPEAVMAMFGATLAGGVFVPVNPALTGEQVAHILKDCNVRVLVTSRDRLDALRASLADCHDLRCLVLTDSDADAPARAEHLDVIGWDTLLATPGRHDCYRPIDVDMAAIFYTSGSTGNPKGVVLSHRNMVAGALSVAQYLENNPADRLLAVLPFSFDYGFSQLSTAFSRGASVVLMDYLFARDVIKAVDKYDVTGLAAVPPLWIQLADLPWPDGAVRSLRYITNSGGAMPTATLARLRASLPDTRVFLMYGLTEAFRSTYLPPEELDRRPESMGKAIPNAEIMVVREDGSPCAPGEPGELVHRGALVSLGYWNDPERTAERFRHVPGAEPGIVIPEVAVWSGDTVMQDEEGFLFFVGRRDDMIKTSGYRVSPTEVEEVLYATGIVAEAAAVGVPHPVLGQGIVVAAVAANGAGGDEDTAQLLDACREHLANYMVPGHVEWRDSLPRNPNGKIDRKKIKGELEDHYREAAT